MASHVLEKLQSIIRPLFSRVNRRQLYWCAGALIFALGSYAFLMHFMQYALLPHVHALSFLYGLDFTFLQGSGYLTADGAMLISADCMGAKLFISAFLLLALGFSPRDANNFHRLRYMLYAYGGTLLGALVISIFRIALSLPFCYTQHAQLIHNILSLVIYFGSLIALFACAQARNRRYSAP